jgi:hypothetical protein
VQTSKQEYRTFLHENFKGLRVGKPLFYSWRFAIRFDLQIERTVHHTKIVTDDAGSVDEEKYFEEVIKRANTLFSSVFTPTDSIFLVFMEYKHRRRKIRSTNFVFKNIKNFEKSDLAYTKEYRLYDPSDKSDVRNVALLKCSVDRIHHHQMLTAIGNSDFPHRQPRPNRRHSFSSPEVYFVNIDRKIIFHMYDDRGLDIISSTQEALAPIYATYNDWILHDNRQQIDKVFGDKNVV